MSFFFNSEISDNKNLTIAFRKLYGIGERKVLRICFFLGICPNTNLKKIKPSLKSKISNVIEKSFTIGDVLKFSLKNEEGLLLIIELTDSIVFICMS
jgi:ribosomal protein S13